VVLGTPIGTSFGNLKQAGEQNKELWSWMNYHTHQHERLDQGTSAWLHELGPLLTE
jgi:hypothetical protein